MLGSRVDAALTDNFLVRGHRAHLRLAGHSGEPPAIHELLEGVGRLSNAPEHRVEVKFDKRTQKLVMRVIPHTADIIMPDGSKACKITIDEKDALQLPKIIQRKRKQHGVPLLSPEDLQKEIKRFKESTKTVENPALHFERSYSFAFVRHAMIKIAYELAFLWLGEEYIDDPSAEKLRNAVCANDPSSTDKLSAHVTNAEGFAAFKLWPANETEHLAYAIVVDDGIGIAVRVFNIHASFVWVTKKPKRFLSEKNANQRLRFIRMNAVEKKKQDIPMIDELRRIALEMAAPIFSADVR